jgi:prophage tail gpP-like protein
LSTAGQDITFSTLATGVTAWATPTGTLVFNENGNAVACSAIENVTDFSTPYLLYSTTKAMVNCVISLMTTPAQSPVTTHFE